MANTTTVTQINTKIKSLLEATFMHISVEGEVASVTYHSSGHVYFSIKDESSTLKCVMWRSTATRTKFKIEQGMHIIVHGSISVYTPRGEYQFIVTKIEPFGQGALAVAYEQLKLKLKEKGYFDASHKKVLPKVPQKIALVTAKESAALQDMLKVAQKRWPLLEITIVDTLVQGEQASSQIARALRYADSLGADIVVVGRGGGSVEDLWAFNEEVVADAIFAMKTPTVSAVGHEVDTLISDFVADLRAPTPSAAMEMILPDINDVLFTLSEYEGSMKRTLLGALVKQKEALLTSQKMLHNFSPKQKFKRLMQSFEEHEKTLNQQMLHRLTQTKKELPTLALQLSQNMAFIMHQKRSQTNALIEKLALSDPKKQRKEGWAQVIQEEKKVALDTLSEGSKFFLVDTTHKVEASVINKVKL
jgi:exodeoxyribonuclease VII large subunit